MISEHFMQAWQQRAMSAASSSRISVNGFWKPTPHYSSRLQKVWLWEDWPGRWGADCGIDLVAKDADDKIWAFQAKCCDPSYSVTKHDVDKFLSESVNVKIDYRLLIATTDQIGGNSRKVILRQNEVIPVSMVLLNDLEQAPLVWPSSADDLGAGHTVKKATPRPHQTKAIEATTAGLVDRGQMVMACVTGKTLTVLWMAERLESKRIQLTIIGSDDALSSANTTMLLLENGSGVTGTGVLFNLINNGG